MASAVHFTASDPQLLLDAVRAAGIKRYMVVGGAGSLEVAPGKKLIDQPDFPEAYKAEAAGGSTFLDMLRATSDLDWTFLSPSAMQNLFRAIPAVDASLAALCRADKDLDDPEKTPRPLLHDLVVGFWEQKREDIRAGRVASAEELGLEVQLPALLAHAQPV